MNPVHSEEKSALVVGAGVAGLTAATVLRRAGWRVDIIERAAELRRGGYKLDVRGAGVGVLGRLGLEGQARERECHVAAGSVVTADGATVAAMGGDTFGGRAESDIELERGDLLALLKDAAGDVAFGRTVVALQRDADGVDARFDDGSECRYDVVMAADGAHSATRRLAGLEPDDGAEHPMGYAIAVAELPDRAGLHADEVTFVAPGATALAYATATRAEARAMLLFRYDGTPPERHEARISLLRQVFPADAWRLPELLAAFERTPGFYLDTMAQVRLPAWSAGRVMLLGDAAACASPASGQGTTIALVSAYVAASLLVASPTRPTAAFADSEARLRPFVAANQKLGRDNIGRMVLPSRAAIAGTLFGLRVINRLRLSDVILGQVARRLANASRVELPVPTIRVPEPARSA